MHTLRVVLTEVQHEGLNLNSVSSVIHSEVSTGVAVVTDDPGCKSPRPWRVIAEEASREYDPRKMADLMQELDSAIEEQMLNKRLTPREKKTT